MMGRHVQLISFSLSLGPINLRGTGCVFAMSECLLRVWGVGVDLNANVLGSTLLCQPGVWGVWGWISWDSALQMHFFQPNDFPKQGPLGLEWTVRRSFHKPSWGLHLPQHPIYQPQLENQGRHSCYLTYGLWRGELSSVKVSMYCTCIIRLLELRD